jgi:hypothetical protein
MLALRHDRLARVSGVDRWNEHSIRIPDIGRHQLNLDGSLAWIVKKCPNAVN